MVRRIVQPMTGDDEMKMLLAAAAAVSLLAAPALADDDHDCGVAAGGAAKPTSEIIRMLEANGYTQIAEVDRDDGCYEVQAHDANGQSVELRVHPGTGEILKTESDDD
jgi:uncharacterized membrane protein YkoI